MALINNIRKRAGLAVGIVAVAMGLFVVGTDLFTSNSAILGKNDTQIGEIAGEKIDVTEFQRELDELVYNFSLRTERSPSENDMHTLRQQAWEMMIVKIAFQQQYDELGLTVTEDEHWDMLQGQNVDFNIRQYFTNPETDEFDRNAILQHLKNLNTVPDNHPQKIFWDLLEKSLDPARYRLKYDNLFVKSIYATDPEAQRAYQEETSVAEIKYLYAPYSFVSADEISYSDEDLKKYYNEHKEDFKIEEGRDLSFVTIDVYPSSEDTLYFKEEMARIAEEFKTVNDDSLFAKSRTDSRDFYGKYSVDMLPSQLQGNFSNLSEGDVRGPYYVNGYLTLYKISEVGTDTVEAARARHILITWENETDAEKAKARREAEGILRQLRSGTDFGQLARENSKDPGSAAKGGDLGWFGRGKMVPPFENAVFNARTRGLIGNVVESQFGYHIIEVTEPATDASLTVASIAREITPSSGTLNDGYLKAELLASSSSNFKEFMENAEKEGLEVLTAEKIGRNERRINVIGNARAVVQWMYRDAAVGDVSKVFELDNTFVVGVLTGKTEEGIAPFDEVKDQVTVKVENKKKAAVIIDKLNGTSGTLDERASAYGEGASVYTSSNLKFSSNTLQTVGFAPEVVGAVFGAENGDIIGPKELENGVIIVEVQAVTHAPEIADYSVYKTQMEDRAGGRVSYALSEAIREAADIKDYRYKFH